VRLDINTARPPAGSVSNDDGHPVTRRDEPFQLYLPRLPSLEDVLKRPAEGR
jgi:hypothetical protein